MPLQIRPLSDTELEAYESQRDLGAELLQAIQEMHANQGQVIYSETIAAREQIGLSQAQFAQVLGVSVRTLRAWEQGQREPSGPAKTLLGIARRHPEVLRELNV